MKNKFIILFIIMFFIGFDKVHALNIGQKIDDKQTVYSINSIDIYIKGVESKLENFLSDKWRTYVKLNDLCSETINICKIVSSEKDKIILTKQYENMNDVYYRTEYVYDNNKYKSLLVVPNSLNFDFGETKTSPDVNPITIDDNLYVPIRFITEALGAEVIYENKKSSENPIVKIDFYSNMDMNFDLGFYENSTKEVYNFKDLQKDKCYDVKINFNNTTINNSKLFTQINNFVKINYNDNKQTNICINDKVNNKSLSFVFNYNGVPIIYSVDENTNKTLDQLYLTGDMTNISKENEVKMNIK